MRRPPFLLWALIALLLTLYGPARADLIGVTDSLSALNAESRYGGDGAGTLGFQLSGTWSATLTFEVTINGTTWTSTTAYNRATGTGATTATSNGTYVVSTAGVRYVRARISSYTSGTVAVMGLLSPEQSVVDGGASGGGGGGGDASAANQTSGDQLTQIVDSSGNKIGATSHALNVNITGGSSSGAVAQGSTTSGQTGGLTQAAVTTAAPTYTTGQTNPLSLNSSGGLRVDPSGVTSPISAASLPLPTGAATAAKQPALGTAGSASTDVLSVQGIASMTPFLTNPGTAANWGTGATGSAVPANAQYAGAISSGNLTGLIQADASAKIDVSTATTTQLVALSSSKKIYVTSWDVVAAGTGTVKLVYGTGSSCGTGTTDLTGAYSLVAQAGLAKGNGLGPVLVVPASNALCVTTSAAVGMQGSVSYTQF